MTKHTFCGFGFGPIQGGLFANEAFRSGAFERIVISEIDQALVDAVRANGGSYAVNVARADCVDVVTIDRVELLNPNAPDDREALLDALARTTEIATCLPSVAIYGAGGDNSVAALIRAGLAQSAATATVIYAAENNNYGAELLEESVQAEFRHPAQYLNTVIGKMSQVVTDPAEILRKKLAPITPGVDRAFLVEEFNRIFVTRCRIENFRPGIEVFIEKDDLIPFEEAKLYGHNAIHALISYLGAARGHTRMDEIAGDEAVMAVARKAFLSESGVALTRKYRSLGDDLFTESGYRDYAEDLLARMTNPHLADTVERCGRDPVRKLGWGDRIFGTMAVCLDQNVEPRNMAVGALAGVAFLLERAEANRVPQALRVADPSQLDGAAIEAILDWIWGEKKGTNAGQLAECVKRARPAFLKLMTT